MVNQQAWAHINYYNHGMSYIYIYIYVYVYIRVYVCI